MNSRNTMRRSKFMCADVRRHHTSLIYKKLQNIHFFVFFSFFQRIFETLETFDFSDKAFVAFRMFRRVLKETKA